MGKRDAVNIAVALFIFDKETRLKTVSGNCSYKWDMGQAWA